MSLSLDQKTRLFARQVQRFHEYSAGTGRPNSKIIKAPDVKLAAALEPAFGMYESGDTKATHESWPFYWQLHGKGCLLTRDLEWFRHMGYELLYSGKVGASDLPRSTYEEPPKQNWDELYGPPAPQQTELERAAMWAETGSEMWPCVNEKPKLQVTVFERRENTLGSQDLPRIWLMGPKMAISSHWPLTSCPSTKPFATLNPCVSNESITKTQEAFRMRSKGL